jgi:hypothetical protein
MPNEVDLRAAIESENAAIVALRTKIGEDPLRLLLQSALDTLSFVSKAFLTPTAMERMRTPAELDSSRPATSISAEREPAPAPGPGNLHHPPVAACGTRAADALLTDAGGLKASTRL